MPWDFWLIFLFLSVVIPWRGYTRLNKLLALPSVDTKEKLALYAVTIAFQWVLVGLVAWRSLVRGLTIQDLGFGSQKWGRASCRRHVRRVSHRGVAVAELEANRKNGRRVSGTSAKTGK